MQRNQVTSIKSIVNLQRTAREVAINKREKEIVVRVRCGLLLQVMLKEEKRFQCTFQGFNSG